MEETSAENPIDSNWAIGTYLRIKPLAGNENESIQCKIQEAKVDDGSSRSVIDIDIPLDADPGLLHNNSASGTLKYEYDHIFSTQANQEDVFKVVAKEKVLDAINGVNGTIFAYGQTGSGKTYSIFGGDSYQERGLIPRALHLIFKELNALKAQKSNNFTYKCRISFIEIYSENVYDLLHTRQETIDPIPTVSVLETEKDGMVLKGLNVYDVHSPEEGLKLFFLGQSHRITSATTMNSLSSRSHAIFTLLIDTQGMKEARTVYTTGKLNFVDLAGSERMYKLKNTSMAIKEAKSINLALHYLEQVIVCLREQKANHYRQQQRPQASATAARQQQQVGKQQQPQKQQQPASSSIERQPSLLLHSETNTAATIAAGTVGAGAGAAGSSGTTSTRVSPRNATVVSNTTAQAPPATTAAAAAAVDLPAAASAGSANGSSSSSSSSINLLLLQQQQQRSISSTSLYSLPSPANNCSSQPQQQAANTAVASLAQLHSSYYIPYRNSVLTNILRDSLGGNCRSSFLLTITPSLQHFEETIATCRFGQRCGEVKVTVSANTEIGLVDQLKELNHRVKQLEKKLSALEEAKKAMEVAYYEEKNLRTMQNSLRTLTQPEQLLCKTCVQELLTAAKESLVMSSNSAVGSGPGLGSPEHKQADQTKAAYQQQLAQANKQLAQEIIEKSQDALYDTVEQMDKAVLVELTTALGELVQSMYIERELAKQEEMLLQAETQRLQAKEAEERQQHLIHQARLQEEAEQQARQARELVRHGRYEEMIHHLEQLPSDVIAKIVQGSVFIKHSNHLLGGKSMRYVTITMDLTCIQWKSVTKGGSGSHAANGGSQKRGSMMPTSLLGSNHAAAHQQQQQQQSVSSAKRASIFGSTMTHMDETVVIPLASFEGVDYDGDTNMITLKGKAQLATKTLHLEWTGNTTNFEEGLSGEEWGKALKFLVNKANGVL